MDTELEKKIELLERQRDNALRLRCPLVAKKFQRMIDKLSMESRNRSMNDKNQKNERKINPRLLVQRYRRFWIRCGTCRHKDRVEL